MMRSERVKAEAARLGFHLVGITNPEPPPHYPVFIDWLAQGRQGEMGYLATERSVQRRADPRLILPECRSILLLGIRYTDPSTLNESEQPGADDRPGLRGRTAAYAWGSDYHDVLPARMRRLVAFLEAEVGHPIPNRWYTDTGPVLERDLAQQAGLGWIGKNTCLINPQQGSYFLLAELLLGIDLEPDPPFLADQCGTCTRCLEACPTQCILPDRTIDARHCISYLTIELKGPIPLELRSQTGPWVFGCDVCQQICPWNLRFSRQPGEDEFTPRPGVAAPDLLDELSLSPQEFNAKFKGSPVKRAKRRGYLRNVAVALGNSGDARAIPALRRALLEDPEPLVRGHAAWALGNLGGETALQALQEAWQVEQDPWVVSEIHLARLDLGDLFGVI